jgi:hypothetical protein
MLEAFRSATGGGPAPAPLEPAPARPAPKSPARPKAAPPPARLPRSPIAFPALPAWLPWVALIGVAFVAGITIGLGKRGVEASEEPAPPVTKREPPPARERLASTPATSSPATAAPQAPIAGLGSESALYDPRNQYCVVVATYGAKAESLAWATYDHLKEANLPVFTPLDVGNKIVILAGAAARSGDLAQLEETIQALSRDGQPRAYADAYRSRIDTFLRR